jgi:hypothetical protein
MSVRFVLTLDGAPAASQASQAAPLASSAPTAPRLTHESPSLHFAVGVFSFDLWPHTPEVETKELSAFAHFAESDAFAHYSAHYKRRVFVPGAHHRASHTRHQRSSRERAA